LVSLALILLSASTVSRQEWFPVRPVLSTYIWFLATSSSLLLVVYLLQIPNTIRYTACRIYYVGYYSTETLICFFSVAVLYEFLFRMAGTNKAIQRTAVIGCVITIGGTIVGTYGLMRQSTGGMLENGLRFLYGTTALAMMASGLLVFAIKKNRSLFLDTRFSMVLAALALINFIDLVSGFILRRNEQIRLVVANMIWVGFSILLYWALKNGPAVSGLVACKSELR
jgi:hypothetical protein